MKMFKFSIIFLIFINLNLVGSFLTSEESTTDKAPKSTKKKMKVSASKDEYDKFKEWKVNRKKIELMLEKKHK